MLLVVLSDQIDRDCHGQRAHMQVDGYDIDILVQGYPGKTVVESRMGAVAWGRWPAPRFPSPLIELDMPISGIQLSDWLHR